MLGQRGSLAWKVSGNDGTSTTAYAAFTTTDNTGCFSSHPAGTTTYTYNYQLRVGWTNNPGSFGTTITYSVTG